MTENKAHSDWYHQTIAPAPQRASSNQSELLASKGPFVWLHGWGQTHESLQRLCGLFKNEGPHYLYDQAGFGKTPKLPDGSGTADYADRLASQLRAKGDGPYILVGHSFGARVSVQLAARHADLVKGIIMIGGAGLQLQRSPKKRLRSAVIKLLGKAAHLADALFKTSLVQKFRSRFGSYDYLNAGDLRPTFVRVVNEDLVAEASRISCPALMLYGENDTEAPPEIGKKYARLISRGRYQELAGFGHLDILTNGAYQCQAYIHDFIAEIESDG